MQVAAHKSNGSDRNVLRKSHARSRISNGVDLLPNVDGRSLVARCYRDISGAIIVDQGGIDQCSESRLQLIRRFAAAAVLAEQLEGRLANGEQVDINEHAVLSSTLVRLAAKIGIDRVPRDVTPSLRELLQAEADAEADAELAGGMEGATPGIAGDTETRISEAPAVIDGHISDDPLADEVVR